MTMGEAVSGLRAWAGGVYATEAAVELLVRSFGGRFADPSQPWIRHRLGGYWLDTDALAEMSGALSSGQSRVLAVVQALAANRPLADLGDVLAGLDRENLVLILAAFSHAAGSHEHALVRCDGPTASYYQPGPIVLWPDHGAEEAAR